MIMLVLPWPPSVNTYYRRVGNITKISAEGRAYRQRVTEIVLQQGANVRMECPLFMEIIAYPPDRRLRDMDNLLKAPWDSLEHAAVYANDNQIKRLEMEMAQNVVAGGALEITLSPFDGASEGFASHDS